MEYVEEISYFGNNPETVRDVRRVLGDDTHTRLEYFEMAQLANLLPQTTDEAKTIILRY